MPSSARKSSISSGVRRGPQKAHIPYRGDNPEVGKKTGIAVQHVERKSDGFEPFEDLIQQADGRTPPRPKGRRKSSNHTPRRYDDDYDDEDGEMSMQLDSPVQHLANMRPPTTPNPITRGRPSSSRPVARTMEVDFDEIPSPRPLGTSIHRTAKAGPSRLSARSPPVQYETPERGRYNADPDGSTFDDYNQPEQSQSPEPSSPQNVSFTQLDQDEADPQSEEEEATPKPHSRAAKGKQRVNNIAEQDPDEEEEEIANGLEDVALRESSQYGAESGEDSPPAKKAKVEPPKPRKRTSASQKENREYREGIRRGVRQRMKPLEYWRGERVRYGKPPGAGKVYTAAIKEIIRVPPEPVVPLGKRKRGTTRGRSRSAVERESSIPPAAPVENPEEGWDDDTPTDCVVLDSKTGTELERRIAYTAEMVQPREAKDQRWRFEQIFTDDRFLAAGQLVIPPGERKPSKATRDNTFVFYVIEGAVNLKIHQTSMVLATGGMFMVPRGNTYFIENICKRNARLFFTQARRVEIGEQELETRARAIEEMRKRKNLPRSSSVGVTTPGKTPPRLNGRATSMALPSTTR